jgi:hypothetical protein
LTDKANNSHGWIGAGAAKFLAAVDELDLLLFDQHDAVGVLRDGVDLQDFQTFCSRRIDKNAKVLVGLVGLVHGSKVFLQAIARRLPTDVQHVYFYFLGTRVVETIVAVVDLIWDVGGRKKKLWEQTMLLLSSALFPLFWRPSGDITPGKSGNLLRMPSQAPIRTRKGAFGPTLKKGGGSLPLAHSQFCLLTPLPISQTSPIKMSQIIKCVMCQFATIMFCFSFNFPTELLCLSDSGSLSFLCPRCIHEYQLICHVFSG